MAEELPCFHIIIKKLQVHSIKNVRWLVAIPLCLEILNESAPADTHHPPSAQADTYHTVAAHRTASDRTQQSTQDSQADYFAVQDSPASPANTYDVLLPDYMHDTDHMRAAQAQHGVCSVYCAIPASDAWHKPVWLLHTMVRVMRS
jgi:hypothetical protein